MKPLGCVSKHCLPSIGHPADMKISLILGAQAVSIKNTMIMGPALVTAGIHRYWIMNVAAYLFADDNRTRRHFYDIARSNQPPLPS